MHHDLILSDLWPEIPETKALSAAFQLSRERLTRAYRFDGESVFHHSLKVANIVVREFAIPNSEMVTLALLHDVVEDGGVSRSELAERFGEEMATSVMILTKDAYPSEDGRNRALRRAVSGASDDVKIVKLADSLENCRSKSASARAEKALENARKMLKKLANSRQSVEVTRARLVVALQISAPQSLTIGQG